MPNLLLIAIVGLSTIAIWYLTEDPMTTIEAVRDAPDCGCCGGNGMHYHYAYVGGTSPEDDDIECSACSGYGKSWFTTRQNACTGYRTLVGRFR